MKKNDLDSYFVSNILKWGAKNYRIFPWRESTNPYHFLIVEILLQKTKAEQVIPIYIEMIKKYPDIESLAKGKLTTLEKIIQPIGLIYRAKRLKAIAMQIVKEFNSKISNDESTLIELKGVGKYIARAILCFGFGDKVSIMDVNVGRIIIRFFGFEEPKRIRDSKELWEKADQLLPKSKYRDFSLYLLDFGSMICSKRKPVCNNCPLSRNCQFYQKQII